MDATTDNVSPPTPAATRNGEGRKTALAVPGGTAATGSPRTARGFIGRLRDGVWAPVVVKAGGVVLGMLALSGIGVASTLSGTGVPFLLHASETRTASEASMGEPWLAPDRTAAPSLAGVSATRPAAAPSKKTTAATTTAATTTAATTTAATTNATGSEPAGMTPDGKVILNTASEEQLTKLPRVGPKRAQAIVALRQKLGRFRHATDLLRVRGIGRKTLRAMLPMLVVDAPVAATGTQKKPGA